MSQTDFGYQRVDKAEKAGRVAASFLGRRQLRPDERFDVGRSFWSRDSLGAPCVLSHMTSQFCVPSYANEALITEFEPFLAALTPVLQKHLHPTEGSWRFRSTTRPAIFQAGEL